MVRETSQLHLIRHRRNKALVIALYDKEAIAFATITNYRSDVMKPRRCTVQSLPRFRYIVYVTLAILDSDFRQIGERVERFGIEIKKRGSGITHMSVSEEAEAPKK